MNRAYLLATIALTAAVASAQVSFDEAQRRLQTKLATRPATTQPVSEVDRLRAENRRLKEDNLALTTEVSQLREALAAASGTPGAAATASTTRPTSRPANDAATRLAGRWEGGDVRAGNAFHLDLAADGSYRQSWVSAPHQEAGHWTVGDDSIVEMWTNQAGAAAPHNRFRVNFSGDTAILTPVDATGADVTTARPFKLARLP